MVESLSLPFSLFSIYFSFRLRILFFIYPRSSIHLFAIVAHYCFSLNSTLLEIVISTLHVYRNIRFLPMNLERMCIIYESMNQLTCLRSIFPDRSYVVIRLPCNFIALKISKKIIKKKLGKKERHRYNCLEIIKLLYIFVAVNSIFSIHIRVFLTHDSD